MSRPYGARTSLQLVVEALSRLNLRPQNRDSFKALCPAHEDRDPSLSVTWADGKTLLSCKSACATEDVMAALGLAWSDLWDDEYQPRERAGRSPQARRSGPRRGHLGRLPALLVPRESVPDRGPARPVKTYEYHSGDGELVSRKIRKQRDDGSKTFVQEYLDTNGSWVDRKPEGFVEVLYRHPQAVQAIAEDQPVWLVGGEKDADTAVEIGLVGCSTANGEGSFSDEITGVFTDATVNVVLDRDAAGWSYGVKVATALGHIGATCALWLPAVTTPKADLTDHVEAGFGVEALIRVSLVEVSAWDQMERAQSAMDRGAGLDQAERECRAQLEAADRCKSAGDSDDEIQHRAHARRWAMEAEPRFRRVSEAVDLAEEAASRAPTPWAQEAAEIARSVRDRARLVAVALHERFQIPQPPMLRGADHGSEQGSQQDGTGQRIISDRFRIHAGRVCRLVPARREGEDDEWMPLLNLDLRLIAREFAEQDLAGEDLAHEIGVDRAAVVSSVPVLVAVQFSWTDPRTGEAMTGRIPADEADRLVWLDSLGLPLDWDRSSRGKATLYQALVAMSGDAKDVVLHRSSGWRRTASGDYFVHAAGAISAEGARDVQVRMTDTMNNYSLPAPTLDAESMRSDFLEHSAVMLTAASARITAPLLGSVYRSVISHNPWVLGLIGGKGTFKTGLTACAMHHLGQRWDIHNPGVSMRGEGDTTNALRIKLHQGKDVAFWLDDFAPTDGIVVTQRAMESAVGMIHEKAGKARSDRTGQEHLPSTKPRASGLLTGEVRPRPGTSGGDRMLVVDVLRGNITLEAILQMDTAQGRFRRNRLMAGFVQWLAGDLDAARQRLSLVEREFSDQLRERGYPVRVSDSVASVWSGWVAITDCLVDIDALSQGERDHLLGQVRLALLETTAATADPDSPVAMAPRIVELLRRALASNYHVVDGETGEAPGWPLAASLGWTRDPIKVGKYPDDVDYRFSRLGSRAGYLLRNRRSNDLELAFDTAALDEMLKAGAAKLSDAPQINRQTALAELAEAGVILTEPNGTRAVRKALHRSVPYLGRSDRLVVLPLDRFTSIEDDQRVDDDAPSWAGGPLPSLLSTAQSTATDPGSDEPGEVLPAAATLGVVPGSTGTGTNEEEVAMRVYTDADGLEVQAESITLTDGSAGRRPCFACDHEAGQSFGGVPAHIPCFMASTAATRAAATAPAPSVEAAPVLPEAPDVTPEAVPARPAAGRRRGQTFTCAAAVLDTTGVYLSDGRHQDLPWELEQIHVGQIAQLAYDLGLGVATTTWRSDPAAVWITESASRALGIDIGALGDGAERMDRIQDVTRGIAAVSRAGEAGWNLGGSGDCLDRWTRVWPGDESRQGVLIGLLPLMQAHGGRRDTPIVEDAPEPSVLARRLGLFAGALGAQFHGNQSTGLDLMKTLRAKDLVDPAKRMFDPHDPVEPETLRVEVDVMWHRPVSSEDTAIGDYLVALDRSGSFLGAVSGCELGYGAPEHHPDGVPTFDPRVPGYHQVRIPEGADRRLPELLTAHRVNPGELVWVTTPALAFARELGQEPAIEQSWVWPQHVRILDPWYSRVRDARSTLDVDDPDAQRVRDQVKHLYVQTIGMLGSDTYGRDNDDRWRNSYHPHWRDMIMGRARVAMLRRIWQNGQKTGRWPLVMRRDTLFYASPDLSAASAWPGPDSQLGRELGRFQWESAGLLVDQASNLQRDGIYDGAGSMIDDLAEAEQALTRKTA